MRRAGLTAFRAIHIAEHARISAIVDVNCATGGAVAEAAMRADGAFLPIKRPAFFLYGQVPLLCGV